MISNRFLDETGLIYFWNKIKTYFSSIIPTKVSDLTNDRGYLTSTDIASVLTYKGNKTTYSALPSSGSIGDVWHIVDTGAEYAWDGSAWQELGTAIDLSNYLQSSDISAWAKATSKPTYTASEVGAQPTLVSGTNIKTINNESLLGSGNISLPSNISAFTNDVGYLTLSTLPIYNGGIQ